MKKKVSPDTFFADVVHGYEPEEQQQSEPKVSLTTGNPDLDKALRFRNKTVRIEASLIECRVHRMHTYTMSQFVPLVQPGLIVYGNLSEVYLYNIERTTYGEDYVVRGEPPRGNWIYLGFSEAYIANANEYVSDALQLCYSWPNNFIEVDGRELVAMRIPWHEIRKIEEFYEKDTPLIRRKLHEPLCPKYGDDW